MGVVYQVKAIQSYMQGNEKKTRYIDCGIVMETSKGLMLKLNAIPVGGDGWFTLDTPRQQGGGGRGGNGGGYTRNNQNSQQRPPQGGNGGFEEMDDDVPY